MVLGDDSLHRVAHDRPREEGQPWHQWAALSQQLGSPPQAVEHSCACPSQGLYILLFGRVSLGVAMTYTGPILRMSITALSSLSAFHVDLFAAA